MYTRVVAHFAITFIRMCAAILATFHCIIDIFVYGGTCVPCARYHGLARLFVIKKGHGKSRTREKSDDIPVTI